MPINIVAERKVKLKGFAEGWDTCFLRVRAVTEEERIQIGSLLKSAEGAIDAADVTPEAEKERVDQLRSTARDIVLGGQIMNTGDDGKVRPYTFHSHNAEDLNAVVDALNIYWLQEALLVATGLETSK